MGRRVNIPVRVIRPAEVRPSRPAGGEVMLRSRVDDAAEPVRPEMEPFVDVAPEGAGGTVLAEAAGPGDKGFGVEEVGIPAETPARAQDRTHPDVDEWHDRALRLQADMANYRKRQQRLAQEQIEAERQRLLGAFLRVVDDLERALAVPAAEAGGLRQGVELTHRAALQLLQKEGVVALEAEGQPFDPNWHEAVATVRSNGRGVEPETVVRVVEPGYRLGERLLRPAKVVVAV
jgi:molecular chaperone GrpE